ncbi:MAG: transglutaminase domain-containing protein [Ruminococcus sp.]|nr:transglutaminase domain-containing protein [Ruminococcus sp.]
MQETEKRTSNLKELAIKYLCDPVLIYTVISMMSIMYHYRDKLTAVYGLVSLIISFILFRIFDFMQKHKFIGLLIYPVIGMLFMFAASIAIENGQKDYPLPFWVWIITPQIAMDYNKWFTLAIYLFFEMYMSSVIYYFTRVRYRIFMSFLVLIIPFTIYGKEAETMPIPFVVLMAMSYIVLMIYFRQLKESGKTVIVSKIESWRSIGAFTLAFVAIASLVPKPEIQADRSALEGLISADRFTDRLVSMLSTFRDSSSGGQFRDVNNTTPLYYAIADEELHLKTNSFTHYNYSRDAWTISSYDNNVKRTSSRRPIHIADNGELTVAIMKAAELDSAFAEKYGLSEYAGVPVMIPEEHEMKIFSVNRATDYAPVPENAVSLIDSSYDDEIEVLDTGLVRGVQRFSREENFAFNYNSDTFFFEGSNSEIINIISSSDYSSLLRDASDVLSDEYYAGDEFDDELITYSDLLWDEYQAYSDMDEYLDYGNEERIAELAAEITEGLDSDYEKARAIEYYFLENDYIYDLSYVKTRGENVVNFLFNTKRGVCFEYATAMVLLSRAAGIPARYCEGFNMSEPNQMQGFDANYVITPKVAHAFPELYINGYGWHYFEPTIVPEAPKEEKKTFVNSMMKAGMILLIILVIALVIIWNHQRIAHRFFMIIVKRKSPEDASRAVMYRICKIYGISGVNTSHEAAEIVRSMSGADISFTAEKFDAVAYGSEAISEEDKEKILAEYSGAYEAFMLTKKDRRTKAKKV